MVLLITAGSKKQHYYDEVEICASSIDKKVKGDSSALNTTKLPTIFEALYTESALISGSSDDTQNNGVPAVLSSEGEQNYYNGERNGTTSEVTYDVPQAMDSAEDDSNCYSSLGPIDYSTLQPHIPKPTQQQLPPTDDQYSCLQHL